MAPARVPITLPVEKKYCKSVNNAVFIRNESLFFVFSIDNRPMEKGLETRQIYPVNDVATRNKSTLRCSPFCTASIEVLWTCEAMYQANNAPKALF